MTPEEVATRAVPLVGQLVTAVHERDADAVGRLIHGASPAALEAACVVLAAMVPDRKSLAELLAWVDLPDNSIDPDDWTDEQIAAAHERYDAGDRSTASTLGQVIWRRREEAAHA